MEEREMKKSVIVLLIIALLALSVSTVFAGGGKVRGEKGVGNVNQHTKSGKGVVSEPIYEQLYATPTPETGGYPAPQPTEENVGYPAPQPTEENIGYPAPQPTYDAGYPAPQPTYEIGYP